MDIQQIPRADLLDILFDGRNKAYGAYDLRKSYNNRLGRSILTTLAICLLLFIGYTVAGKTHPAVSRAAIPEIDLTPVDLSQPKKELPLPIPKPAPATPPAPTLRMVTTRIVPDVEVKPQDQPQPAVVPDNFRIGTTTNLIATGDDVERPISSDNGNGLNTGLINKPVTKDNEEEGIQEFVQIESSYKGGTAAWQRFLLKNFRPPEATGDESGNVTVVVRFIVDKEGNVSDVEPISGPAALQKEAVRVIRLSGKWEPAIQNGRKVKSYKMQPITVHWEN
jgi:protein TonB